MSTRHVKYSRHGKCGYREISLYDDINFTGRKADYEKYADCGVMALALYTGKTWGKVRREVIDGGFADPLWGMYDPPIKYMCEKEGLKYWENKDKVSVGHFLRKNKGCGIIIFPNHMVYFAAGMIYDTSNNWGRIGASYYSRKLLGAWI